MRTILKIVYSISLCCIVISCNDRSNNPSTGSQSPQTTVHPPDTPRDTTVARTGDEIYQAHCMFCHGASGNKSTMGAENLKVSLIDSLSIVQTIKNGKSKMPPFDDQFSDVEMSSLVAYVKALRTTKR